MLVRRCWKNAQKLTALNARLVHTSGHTDSYYVGNQLDAHANLPRALQNKKPARAKGAYADKEPKEKLEMHMKDYERGKRWLAKMMGEDHAGWTQEDMNRAVAYLLPSPLYATDARPVIKHPQVMYRNILLDVRKLDPSTDRPYEAAFFTGFPNFHNVTFQTWNMLAELENLERDPRNSRRSDEPVARPVDGENIRWINRDEFKRKMNESLDEVHYAELFNRFKRIHVHPCVTPEMNEFLNEYQVIMEQEDQSAALAGTELVGREARAMGYRKTSVADVFVSHGSGVIKINDKLYTDYFRYPSDKEQVCHPFLITATFRKYDVRAYVINGGPGGQSGAVRMGISRALAVLSPHLRSTLGEGGLLEHDNRKRERKKPGRKRARMRYAWKRR